MRAQNQTNKKSGKSSVNTKTAERSKPMESKTKKTSSSPKISVKPSSKQSSMQKKQQESEQTDTTFRFEAPEAQQVSVVGCFNNWDPRANFLESDGNGVWSCTLSIEPGEHEYRFIVDGMWCDDPDNLMRRPNGLGTENCVLVI
ncbi:MAG TPA: isoamylase early set domain-containing protein [Syntrophorhabdaceae bacterium]|nr:isoamylase early set domain-containing protein [Syntrophorhabdaceae bacterium]